MRNGVPEPAPAAIAPAQNSMNKPPMGKNFNFNSANKAAQVPFGMNNSKPQTFNQPESKPSTVPSKPNI